MTIDMTDELVETICGHIMEGVSMRKIGEMEGMPSQPTMLRWLRDRPEFEIRCARAWEIQAHVMADRIRDVAENSTADSAPADRVKLSGYQWVAAKLHPKKYGDVLRHKVGGEKDGSPVPVRFESMTNAQLASFVGRLDSEIDTRESTSGVGSETSQDD